MRFTVGKEQITSTLLQLISLKSMQLPAKSISVKRSETVFVFLAIAIYNVLCLPEGKRQTITRTVLNMLLNTNSLKFQTIN